MKKYLNKEYILEHKETAIKIGIGTIIFIIILGIYLSNGKEEKPDIVEEEPVAIEEKKDEEEVVVVDISGAVLEDRVAKLPVGSRVDDAINAAGGITEDADLSGINRAAVLNDGEKIYIPTADEVKRGIELPTAKGNISDDGRININTATVEELETLKGVGPVTAEKIIEYRTQYGEFTSVEGIMEVNGIGEKTYSQLKDYIKV